MATKVTNGLDLNSQKIVNVADPTANQDAATKKFVDDHNWASTDITDFAEAVDDQVNTLIVAGTGITKTYNDGAGTLTLAASGAAPVDIQVFTSSADWTKPTGGRFVDVICIAGGGGGGSGGLQFNSTLGDLNAQGGTPGGQGNITFVKDIYAALLPDTVSVTVGSGGGGGASRTTASTTGNNGTAGGSSGFASYVTAAGGSAGSGSNSYGNSAGFGGWINFGSSATNGVAGTTGGGINIRATRSGVSSISVFSAATAGSAGTAANTTTAAATATAGGDGTTLSGDNRIQESSGGGGGGGARVVSAGAANSCIGGNGGAGGYPGGGGGGGGGAGVQRSSLPTGSKSGAGGTGGNGFVAVITWF